MAKPYNRKDSFYQKAKDEGYRSRASYKLLELNKKYNVLKNGGKILDLGAWPGGWLQVAAQKVKTAGIVVGIDLVEIEKLPNSNVFTLMGDVNDQEVIDKALQLAGDKFDVVMSDMSPKLSGIKELDAAGTVHCAEISLEASRRTLKNNGHLIIKMFKSAESDNYVRSLKSQFARCDRTELDATRKTSNEFYFVGIGFRGEEAK